MDQEDVNEYRHFGNGFDTDDYAGSVPDIKGPVPKPKRHEGARVVDTFKMYRANDPDRSGQGDCGIKQTGVKYSSDKIKYSLVPPYALKEAARNLTVGLKKYPDPLNWTKVPNAKQEYLDALMRHLESYRMGNKYDKDSLAENMHEMAAIIVNAMFILEFDLNPNLVEVKE